MAKHLSERSIHPERVPPAPPPSADCARDGMTCARERARRFLPNALDLLAGLAFGASSEAGLYTRLLCVRSIMEIAGVIPATPPAPPPSQEIASDGCDPN